MKQEVHLNRRLILLVSLLMVAIALVACSGGEQPAPAPQSSAEATQPAPVSASSSVAVSSAASSAATSSAAPKLTVVVIATPSPAASSSTPVKSALSCPAVQPLAANAQLAARVNGQGIPLDPYNKQMAQAQAALVQNGGLNPNTPQGQEAIKSLKQQVLDQMINDVVIALQADKEGIKVTDNDLNARLAQMIQDAGSVERLNDYLKTNQLSLADLCSQVRNQLIGEAMLNRVTAALPQNAEQVHARHILVASAQQAQAIRDQLLQGKDFVALAKQYSLDEATKNNGGDLGWFPKDVMDPRFEAIAFQLRPSQISEVVQTQFGFHIIKVDEHEQSRPLPPEVIQNKRQQAFLAWLQAIRGTMKIEQLVQP